jgi:hypothetical protein
MKVEIAFTVQRAEEASHHTDLRFSKVFDVEWPGRPQVGEGIDLDVGPPGDKYENEWKVAAVYWSTEGPTLVVLEPIVIPPDEQEQLDGYRNSLERRNGWKVTGGPPRHG